LATRIRALFSLPGTLTRAAACARAVGAPDAAENLATLVEGLLPAEGRR
jgi:UDP-N-acetylglucosamine--N-acetylmuramyl-(pentapeptide) pyrophosphoryl-undecaprenol N-acetylglucosamine transferase